jgi:protein-(glutamine-N5) methyltransferase, release factor-specific
MNEIEYLKKYLPSDKLEDGIKRLNNGEPVQYIVGNVDFYGYKINVNKNVLIPRFETEELVFKTINLIKKNLNENIKVLDIGTGSGCISIALKKEIPGLDITAVDISEDALVVAKNNALENNCEINFIKSDLFNNIGDKYDLIISNPPYISYDEQIMDIVKKNEPHLALYAKNNGLYFYEEIIKNSSNYLNDKNIIAFEIGYLQANEIKKMAHKYYPNSNIIIEKDMQEKDRFVFIINL